MKVSETFWLTTVANIQTFSILITVILFLILPRPKKLMFLELGLVLILSLATEIITSTGILVFHKNMNMVPNIFRFFNLPLVILMYRAQINWRHKNILAFMFIAVFEILALINFFFIQGPKSTTSYTASLASFCIVLMSMTYFFGYEPKSLIESNTRSPMYWINIALLWYYCTTFFINIWVDYLVNVVQSNLINIWIVHNSLGVIFYLTICYALILIRKQEVSPSTQNLG